jgi:uncharacterized membrane protein
MNLSDILSHLLAFAAPALALAVLLPLAARLLNRNRTFLLSWRWQIGINFAVGLGAMLAAVWWLGRDGKMLGYSALALAVATSQWLLVRGWRR